MKPEPPPKTGWPPPELAQDECRKLFRWFASRLDAKQRVRENAERIRQAVVVKPLPD